MASDSTRQRVLEAAGEVFAREGFKAATVREIVEKAGANLSAVNYHFRDKETLYSEVLNYLVSSSVERYPIDGGADPQAQPHERLRAYVRSFLCRALCVGQPAWKGDLMTREMMEPSPMFNTVVERVVLPIRQHLERLVSEISPADPRDVALRANSIIAQCVFYKHFERFAPRLSSPTLPAGEERIELLTDHITRFSLAGMTGFSKETQA